MNNQCSTNVATFTPTHNSQESVLHRINSLSRELQSGLEHLAQIAASGRTVLATKEAAFFLDFKQQTLRKWACYDNGPIRPVRIGGRLRWKISEILDLLEGGTK